MNAHKYANMALFFSLGSIIYPFIGFIPVIIFAKTNGVGAAFIRAIMMLSVLILPVFLAITGLVLGIIALVRIHRQKEQKGLAKAIIAVSIFSLWLLLYVGFIIGYFGLNA